MVDAEQFATVAGLAALIVLLLQVFGPRPVNGEPSPRLPYYAVGLGVVFSFVVGFSTERIARIQDCGSWLIGGILAGLSAVGYQQAAQFGQKRRNGHSKPKLEVQGDG